MDISNNVAGTKHYLRVHAVEGLPAPIHLIIYWCHSGNVNAVNHSLLLMWCEIHKGIYTES